MKTNIRDLYTHVDSTFICHSQTPETTQTPTPRQVTGQTGDGTNMEQKSIRWRGTNCWHIQQQGFCRLKDAKQRESTYYMTLLAKTLENSSLAGSRLIVAFEPKRGQSEGVQGSRWWEGLQKGTRKLLQVMTVFSFVFLW